MHAVLTALVVIWLMDVPVIKRRRAVEPSKAAFHKQIIVPDPALEARPAAEHSSDQVVLGGVVYRDQVSSAVAVA
jgi:hypothetical protein